MQSQPDTGWPLLLFCSSLGGAAPCTKILHKELSVGLGMPQFTHKTWCQYWVYVRSELYEFSVGGYCTVILCSSLYLFIVLIRGYVSCDLHSVPLVCRLLCQNTFLLHRVFLVSIFTACWKPRGCWFGSSFGIVVQTILGQVKWDGRICCACIIRSLLLKQNAVYRRSSLIHCDSYHIVWLHLQTERERERGRN